MCNTMVHNDKGAVILIALMTLALMMIIGLTAVNMSISESFSIRNIGIQKQNLRIVEGAALEGVQRIMDMEFDGDISDLDPKKTSQVWVCDDDQWSNAVGAKWTSDSFTGPVLNENNSTVPQWISAGGGAENLILAQRGEWNQGHLTRSSLRYTLVGWNTAGGNTLRATAPARRSGRLLAEYASDDFGILRIEIGLERKF